MDHQDELFGRYISALGPILKEHGANTDALQKRQVNRLIRLEKDFRRALVRHPRGMDAYRHFIDQCKNRLTARPFFRERDETFKSQVSAALKAKDPVALTRFCINRQFIEFVLKLGWWKGAAGRKLLSIAQEHLALRQELVECNLPLAISQAKRFFAANQQSHLSYMDINQIGAIGLMEAIDKFSGPYTKSFRSVIIGRMLGNFIEENSQTFVHYFPPERKALYRLRKILRVLPKDGPVDWNEAHRLLNEQEQGHGDKLTSFSDMLHIFLFSTVVSATVPENEDGEDCQNPIDQYPDDQSLRPDTLLEEAQARRAAAKAIKALPLFDQKLLRMRGVEL